MSHGAVTGAPAAARADDAMLLPTLRTAPAFGDLLVLQYGAEKVKEFIFYTAKTHQNDVNGCIGCVGFV